MKKLFALTIAVFLTAPAFASTNYKFVGVDADIATQICVTAAQEGVSEARKQARKVSKMTPIEFHSTMCNGYNIKDFASKFTATESVFEAKTKVTYQFKLVDNSFESKTCQVAAEEGYKAAVKFGGKKAKAIVCNGKSLNRFARQYASI